MDWQEFWLPIERFPAYEVSNYGEVRHLYSGNYSKLFYNKDGYPVVCLYNKTSKEKLTKPVHILSGLTFLGIRGEGKEINHIDLDRTNPAVMNLEYTSRGENSKHSYDNLKTHKFAAYNNAKKRSINMLDKSGGIIKVFNSLHSAADYAKALPANILRCCNGKLQHTVKGFGWEYVDPPKPRVYGSISMTENIIPVIEIVACYTT